jgi:hypothetical protein
MSFTNQKSYIFVSMLIISLILCFFIESIEKFLLFIFLYEFITAILHFGLKNPFQKIRQTKVETYSEHFVLIFLSVFLLSILNTCFFNNNAQNIEYMYAGLLSIPLIYVVGISSLLILKTPYLPTDIFSQIFSVIVFFSIYSINWTYAVMGCIICIVVAISLLMRYKKI